MIGNFESRRFMLLMLIQCSLTRHVLVSAQNVSIMEGRIHVVLPIQWSGDRRDEQSVCGEEPHGENFKLGRASLELLSIIRVGPNTPDSNISGPVEGDMGKVSHGSLHWNDWHGPHYHWSVYKWKDEMRESDVCNSIMVKMQFGGPPTQLLEST